MKSSLKAPDMTAVGVMNFTSTLITTCFCAYVALVGHREAPVFSRQALDMLFAGGLFHFLENFPAFRQKERPKTLVFPYGMWYTFPAL